MESLDDLIMVTAFSPDYEDFVDYPVPVLTIIGSRDPDAPQQESFYEAIADSARRVVIDGGNHRQYAGCSVQRGDGIATISISEQQDQLIAAIVRLLDALKQP